MISWHLDVGSILNAVSLILIAVAGAKKLGALELKIGLLWDWFKAEHDLKNGGK